MWNFFKKKSVKEYDIICKEGIYYPTYKGRYLFKLINVHILKDSKYLRHCGVDTEQEALDILDEFKKKVSKKSHSSLAWIG